MASAPVWREPAATGPVVWWVRNDLRLTDNPVVRASVAEALTDGRDFHAVFVFDPRFLDRSNYGRVTDPEFKKSISTRKPINFGNRKTCALRARFWLRSVRALGASIAARGGRLLVCKGLPETVLGGLPESSLVVCQAEPVSPEQMDVEGNVEVAIAGKGCSVLRRQWGAMSLYHRDDLPFRPEADEMPGSYTELGIALGWEDVWTTNTQTGCWVSSNGRETSSPAPVRPPVAAPTTWPALPVAALELPGTLADDVLENDAKALASLGYSDEEIAFAMADRAIPEGGEAEARALMERWLVEQQRTVDNPQSGGHAVFWDLPCGGVDSTPDGHDPMQWTNLAQAHGWMRISHYMAIGCISAREMFARAATCPNFTGVVHRLLWREFHRLNAITWGRRLYWLQGPGRVERPWSWDPQHMEAWTEGKTGVPYIDACMRELRQTGWLAYKGRKTAGFFLVFGLGVDWRVGAFVYEDLLLDYDVAMNYGNWVVVAEVDKHGRGRRSAEMESVADIVEDRRSDIEHKLASEIANDPTGEYIRRWVPELRNVSGTNVHRPWLMTEAEMTESGCIVGKDYPASLVGPLDLSAGELQVESGGADIAERRVHPHDPSGNAYTKEEYLQHYSSQGKGESFGLEMWEEAVPVLKLSARIQELESQLQAKESELAALRKAAPGASQV